MWCRHQRTRASPCAAVLCVPRLRTSWRVDGRRRSNRRSGSSFWNVEDHASHGRTVSELAGVAMDLTSLTSSTSMRRPTQVHPEGYSRSQNYCRRTSSSRTKFLANEGVKHNYQVVDLAFNDTVERSGVGTSNQQSLQPWLSFSGGRT